MKKSFYTRVKICGITSVDDARNVCDAGADAIGLVFYEKSARNVSIELAKEICDSLPPFISSVGLFLDASPEFVNSVLASVPLDLLQFHGSESPEYCASFNRPYMKAVGIKNMSTTNDFADFKQYAKQFPDAKAFLVDSHGKGDAGGTGETFDWKNTPQDYDKPIILAGGLKPENIADAIKQTSVFAVDLSSGVESSPGIKDREKIMQLMKEVRNARKQ